MNKKDKNDVIAIVVFLALVAALALVGSLEPIEFK